MKLTITKSKKVDIELDYGQMEDITIEYLKHLVDIAEGDINFQLCCKTIYQELKGHPMYMRDWV